MIIQLSALSIMERQAWLQHAIAPRPIAFASTIDAHGNVNLSPFSFFNLFSSNPPIVIFSPSRRGRDNTTKHTLENVLEIPEVVINICHYAMVQQVSLSSCEYPKGTDEFVKAGFTKQNATQIRPPMVQEAPIQLECKVNEVKSLGNEGGAGQLIIAEVLVMHVQDAILNQDGSMIDPFKIEHIARLGGDWYCRTNRQNLFTVPKPNTQLGIGIDELPASIRQSNILTGNHLGQLANVHQIPVVNPAYTDDTLKNIVQYFGLNPTEMEAELHTHAAQLLNQGKTAEAWQVLLAGENA
jgi:flavin reductase (DIM6/NTAB) family NADH-FMN oxidoreductase RutF